MDTSLHVEDSPRLSSMGGFKTDASKGAGAGPGRGEVGAAGGNGVQPAAVEGGGAGEQEPYPYVPSAPSRVAYRVGVANLVAGAGGAVASAMAIGWTAAAGFAAGYIIGVANIWLLFNIVKKSVKMTPQDAGNYASSRYYMRYAATIIIFSVLIATGVVAAWPAMAGLTVCIFTTIISMIFAAREETY